MVNGIQRARKLTVCFTKPIWEPYRFGCMTTNLIVTCSPLSLFRAPRPFSSPRIPQLL